MDDPLDCNGAPGTGAVPETYFDASRCEGGVQRAISLNEELVMETVDSYVPAWNVVLVIINSDLYAGSSNPNVQMGAVTTSSTTELWIHRALHELGHAAFDLADEYEYWQGCDSSGPFADDPAQWHFTYAEPIEPNVTTNSDLATIKWANWVIPTATVVLNLDCTKCNPPTSPLPRSTIGAFEGAYYHHCGIFRPAFDCRMRHHDIGWCPVCASYMTDKLLWYSVFQTWPADNAPGSDVDSSLPMLAWTPGNFESAWELQITDEPTFGAAEPIPIVQPTTDMFGQTVAFATDEIAPLKPGTTYQWRVRKVSAAPRTAGWTQPRMFTTAGKKAQPLKPRSDERTAKHYPWGLEFRWVGVDGAAQYEIEVTDQAGPIFQTPQVTVSDETSKTLNVRVNAHMQWRVRAIPPEGPNFAGVWSDPCPLITEMPKVTIDSPENDELVPPWPVTLRWNAVEHAAMYAVEIERKKTQWGLQSLQKPLNGLWPETTHVDLNMRPRPTADDETHDWRVRVWGPEPLEEEGQDSGWHTFVNDGDKTVPPEIVQIDLDPGSEKTWGGWNAHKDGAEVYWDATVDWGWVTGAVEYHLTPFARPTTTGPPGSEALDLSIPVKDDPNDHNWAVNVRTDKENFTPPPGIGVVGYSVEMFALGPEDLTGLSSSEVFGPNQVIDLIEPDEPTVIAPDNQASGIHPDELIFSFTSEYTPSGKYRVLLEGLLPGGSVHAATIAGNPGAETTFDLATFGLVESDLLAEKPYLWRVRAFADEPDLDAAYAALAWGPKWWFTTAPAPPNWPSFVEEHCAELPCIFDRLFPTPGATQYDWEYQEIPVGTLDPSAPTTTGNLMKVTWLETDLQEQTSLYESLTGVSLPNGQAAVPLPETVCDQLNFAYRGRFRLCKSANCSKFTEWFMFWGDQ